MDSFYVQNPIWECEVNIEYLKPCSAPANKKNKFRLSVLVAKSLVIVSISLIKDAQVQSFLEFEVCSFAHVIFVENKLFFPEITHLLYSIFPSMAQVLGKSLLKHLKGSGREEMGDASPNDLTIVKVQTKNCKVLLTCWRKDFDGWEGIYGGCSESIWLMSHTERVKVRVTGEGSSGFRVCLGKSQNISQPRKSFP